MGAVVIVGEIQGDAVGGKEVLNGAAPFDDDDVAGVGEIFGEVVGHEARIGEAIKIVVNQAAAIGESVGF